MNFTRRSFLQGTSAAAALGMTNASLERLALAQTAKKRSVLILTMQGGYNALFSSAKSFEGTYFGVTGNNYVDLGGGLTMDKAFIDGLGPYAKTHVATAGIRHGSAAHTAAQTGFWMGGGTQSAPLLLASSMANNGPIRAAEIVRTTIAGNHAAVNGVSLQGINNLRTTIDTLQGTNAADPNPILAIPGTAGSEAMSQEVLNLNPQNLRTDAEARKALAETLKKPTGVPLDQIPTAYGVPIGALNFNTNYTAGFAAAEVMIRAGTSVVTMNVGGGWDSHQDINGASVRSQMMTKVVPGAKLFIDRMMADATLSAGHEVTLVLAGEFARSIPGSNHAAATSVTVIGPRVKVGSTGVMTAGVSLTDQNVGSWKGFWALLSQLGGATGTPFDANPHSKLVLP